MVLGFVIYEMFDLAIHAIKLGGKGIKGAIYGIHGVYGWICGKKNNSEELIDEPVNVAELELRIMKLEKIIEESKLE